MNIIDWLQAAHPQLLEELLLLDRATDGALFHDPGHTLSYNIAQAAKDGNVMAQMLCRILDGLSADHCQHALDDESTQQWDDATHVVGVAPKRDEQ